jgi:Na+-driven multidrug efflux pump
LCRHAIAWLTIVLQVLLLVLIIICDGVQGINAGVLRGAGLPTAAARINLLTYWLIGLPVVRRHTFVVYEQS